MDGQHMKRAIVAALIAAGIGAMQAKAQDFPSRPITLVVALPAGGGVDALARTVAEHMKTTLGQSIIVENMGGAGGTLSIARVVRSAADGYTLGMGTLGQYVISGAVYTLSYDMLADLTPVSLLPSVPYWMIARKNLPANNLEELVAWLKANPDKASATTVGTASLARFCGMFFQKATGTSFQFVPYRGGAPALQDVVAGNIDLSCDLAANSLPQFRNGNVKALAVMSKQRWFAAPDIPTAEEAGVPGIDVSTWHGIWAPKGAPPAVVAKIDAAVQAALKDPATQKRIADLGMIMPPADRRTPTAFAAFHKAEVEKWYPIVRAAGIKAQ
ncbi:MAG: tripartite tricarboxylate transporter substrate binding protein BugD [Alphaproteobacteria bacterium]|nr:tripartite tricarboxylate transporter substrate binding protein BugD [Alphaproteobacteria bacterium]